MGLEEVPVDDVVVKERVDMLVDDVARRAIEFQALPVADAWQQLDPQQVRQSKNRQVLPLSIRVDGGRGDVRAIAYQAVENMHRLPDRAGDELREEHDIHITHMMVGNAPEPSIADVLLCQQILLRQLILRSINGGPFLLTPIVREGVAIEAINNIPQRRIQLLDRDMPPVDMRNLIRIERASQVPGHLVRA